MNADAILKLIDEISQRISEPAQQVFEMFVKQSFAYGILDIGIGCVCLLITLIFGIWIIAELKDKTSESGWIGFCLFMIGCSTIGWISLFSFGFLRLYNPVYYAIKDLTMLIK